MVAQVGYDAYAAPLYEWCNAVSMVFALLCGVVCAHEVGWSRGSCAMLATTALHLPVSFGYHAGCALRLFESRVDNAARMMDQSMVLVACAAAAYCTSASTTYSALVTAWAAGGIPAVWTAPTTEALKRRRRSTIAGGVALYMAPTARRALASADERANLITAAVCFGMGALCLAENRKSLRGWGHCVFHVWIAGLQVAILRSGLHAWRGVEGWSVEDLPVDRPAGMA